MPHALTEFLFEGPSNRFFGIVDLEIDIPLRSQAGMLRESYLHYLLNDYPFNCGKFFA